MADLTIDQLPEATSISNDDIMIVAAANSSTAKKIKASLVVGRPSPGSGHVIVDGNGSDMPQRPNLQFAGETVSVVDDPTLGRTVVEVAGSELKPATATTLGGVIVGKNIEVDAEGVISTLGGHTVQGPDGTPLAQQPNIQFTGDFVTATDQAASERTVVDVTVPPATTQKPGIVQVGGGLDVDDAGVVSTVRGHEVVDPEGNIMAQEDQIQFTGDAVSVTDDPTAKRTTVDVTVPFASKDKAGIVQVGEGIDVSETGIISAAGAEPKSYFPANASLRFWFLRYHTITVPYSSAVFTAYRFFSSHISSFGTSVLLVEIPGDVEGNRALRVSQRTGGNFNHPIVVWYPFMPDETAPLSGKTVTFSFDIQSDHAQVAAETIGFDVRGTTATTFTKLNSKNRQYASGNTDIGSGSIDGLTTEFSRKSFTFDIPEGITQICLQWTYSADESTGPAIGDVITIARLRIDIGSTAYPYRTPNYADEFTQIQKVQTEIYAWRQIVLPEGSTNRTAIYRQQFPIPMAINPTVLFDIEITSPLGFARTSRDDVSEVNKYYAIVSRTLPSGINEGEYFTAYAFGVPFIE